MISFVVPVKPVGVNGKGYAIRRTASGRAALMKTELANDFAEAIATAGRMALRGLAALGAPAVVTFVIWYENERPDIDGPIKPLLDSLQVPRGKRPGAGVFLNDRQVRRLMVERDTDAARPRVEVYVERFVRRMLPLPPNFQGASAPWEPGCEPAAAPRASKALQSDLLSLLPPKRRGALLERRLVSSVRRP